MALITKNIKPTAALSDFVESYWMLHNASDEEKEVILLPDGRIDLFFSSSGTESFHVTLIGLGTLPTRATIAPQTLTFAISFNLLATEYILHQSVAGIVDSALDLPADFWGFSATDLHDFDLFCRKASQKITTLLPASMDERKRTLFQLIYSTNGAMTVKALSEKVFWSSRQINRYFSRQYGLSLKSYCMILLFRASFQHIKAGKLFPEQDFTDQSHFIKAVKKLAGVSLKELNRNQNDRFIQFSLLPGK